MIDLGDQHDGRAEEAQPRQKGGLGEGGVPAPVRLPGDAIGGDKPRSDQGEPGQLGKLRPVRGHEAHGGKTDQHGAEDGEDGRGAPRVRRAGGVLQDCFGVGGRHPSAFDPEIDIAFEPLQVRALPHLELGL